MNQKIKKVKIIIKILKKENQVKAKVEYLMTSMIEMNKSMNSIIL